MTRVRRKSWGPKNSSSSIEVLPDGARPVFFLFKHGWNPGLSLLPGQVFPAREDSFVNDHRYGKFLAFLVLCGWTAAARAQTSSSCCQGVTQLGGFGAPAGMAIDNSRNLIFMADRVNAALYVFTTAGSPVTHFSSWTGGNFTSPSDVALDSQGNAYLADYNGQAVYEFRAGTYAYVGAIASGQVSYPRGVFAETQGTTVSLYISSQDNNVYRYDSVSGGAFTAAVTFGGSAVLNVPTGILKQGNAIYVVDDGGALVQFTVPGYAPTTLYTGASDLKFIKQDLAGHFYVSESLANFLDEFLAGLGNPPSQCAIPNNPRGIVVDGNGHIFVAEDSGGAVTELQGCLSGYQGQNPPAPGDFFIYPSPARGGQATVSYNMAQAGQVDLKIWNERAELAAHITDSEPAGVQATPFSIAGFGPGVYFYALTLTYASGQVEKLGPKKFAVVH